MSLNKSNEVWNEINIVDSRAGIVMMVISVLMVVWDGMFVVELIELNCMWSELWSRGSWVGFLDRSKGYCSKNECSQYRIGW